MSDVQEQEIKVTFGSINHDDDDPEVRVQHGTMEIPSLPFTIIERVAEGENGYPPTLYLELEEWIGEQIAEAYKKATGRELIVQIYGRDYT